MSQIVETGVPLESGDVVAPHAQGETFIQTRLDQAIEYLGQGVSLLFLIGVLVSAYEIVARYLFNAPTIWAHETTIGLVALCYLFGGAYALSKNTHIRIGLLYFSAGPRAKRLLDSVNAFLAVVFFVGVAWAGWKLTANSWLAPDGSFRLEGTGSAWNPPLPPLIKGALILLAAAMTLQSTLQFLRQLRKPVSQEERPQNFRIFSGFLAAIAVLMGMGLFLLFEQGRSIGVASGSLIILGGILLLMLTGLPLAIATGIVALLFTLGWFGPSAVPIISSRIYSFITEYVLVAVPMFVLMASLLDRSGIARDLYNAMRVWAGELKGGVAVQTLLAALFLAAISGIIGGEIVLLGLVALPQMLRLGYDKGIAIGTVCAGGSLGTMIPPSIVLIVYGLTASVSIGELFLATITPGVLLASLYILYILTRCTLNPNLGPVAPREERDIPLREKLKQLKDVVLPLLVGGTVLGSIYGGIASVTEAACLGVVGVLLSALVRGELHWSMIKASLRQTLDTCGMIIWIGIGASALVGVYNLMGGNRFIQGLILGFEIAPIFVILVMMAILIVLGMFMDWIGIALLTMPIFVPIVIKLGFDPIWFGILFAMNMQVSYLTPPFGPAAFYLKSVAPSDIGLARIFKSLWPFILLQCVALALVLFFPEIALWLPHALD